MRISTASAFQATIDNLQQRQQALVDAQQRLSSGKRVSGPGDDPAAAARAERALAAQSRAEAAQRVVQASRTVVQQAESALGDGVDLLQQARELVVSAGDGSYSDAERQTIADALRSLRARLFAVANRGDGSGGVLFGGQGSTSTPFVDDAAAAGGVRYDGTAGALQVVAGEPLPMSVDGRAAWLAAPDPVSGSDDLSPFAVLGRVADELSTPGRDGTAISEGVRNGLRDLDATLGHLSAQRAALGDALGRSDAVEMRLQQASVAAQTGRSAAEDLDMVQAISDFQNQQTGYSAALQTYSTVQRMSLLDYLR
jgi:flagellar hook-associated protein 3 FlgL